jgi:hypothetical protein
MRALLILATLLLTLAALGDPLPRGHVFYKSDFESPDALKPFSAGARLDGGYHSEHAMLIERDSAGSTMVHLRLPAEQMRGYTIYCFAMARAEDISHRPQPWNGVKFMAPMESPSTKLWPQASVEDAGFEWKQISFSARVPRDATRVTLSLGLEGVSGKVWFDDLRVAVGKLPPPEPPQTPPAGPPYRGANLPPRLRGAMIPATIDEAGLRTLGHDWNANLVRWQLIRYGPAAKIASAAEFDGWLDREIARLDAALPLCRQYGLRIVLDLHSPWGGKATVSGYVGSDDRLFTDKTCQDHFVECWQKMATHYKDTPEIWAYDLANEPVEPIVPDGCDDWHDLAQRAGKAIRAIDSSHALIVEPENWGGPDAFAGFYPIDVPGVVYSVHMYVPGSFTHQSVFNKTNAKSYRYPGVIEGSNWDRAALENALKPVIEFQKTWNVSIYVGEFSAIRWAADQSACRYLSDVIDVFEAHGWDWSYHAFREWHGWSVEHGEDRDDARPAAQPTERQKLLTSWYAKNQK